MMKRDRKWLSVLLGLVLLVQGVAVSAAPCTQSAKAAPAAMAMDADLPCHGQQADPAADQSAQDGLPCCGSDCPNMTSCMLGHLAISASFQLTTVHTPDAAPHLLPVRIISHSPPTLLRPPITLHG